MEELELAFREHFDRLPEAVQEYVLHGNYSSEIATIGHQFKFHIDKMGQLSDFVTYVLVGIIPTHEAEKKFAEYLPEYAAQAKVILGEIEHRILSSVRNMTKIPAESKVSPEQITAPSAIMSRPTTAIQQPHPEQVGATKIPLVTTVQKPILTQTTPPTNQTVQNQGTQAPVKTVGKEIDKSATPPKSTTDPYREPVD